MKDYTFSEGHHFVDGLCGRSVIISERLYFPGTLS